MSDDLQQSPMRPLNPTLYSALRARFGSVIVANEGARMSGAAMPHWRLPGQTTFVVATWGEYYRVCCGFCGDRRHRLWINHQYGVPNLQSGYPDSWLAVCYNEGCTKENPARRQQLEQMIFGFRNATERRRPVVICQGEDQSGPLVETEPPGEIMRLTELAPSHDARTYLINRNFDPDWLYENFRLGYVLNVNDERFRAARSRIYIPVFFEGKLVGWQTRFTYDPPKGGPAKYYTKPGMPRKRVLYNYDTAKRWSFVVVVEGCPAVWRIGGPAVAMFGKSLTAGQQILLQNAWAGKPIFLMLDPDARDEMEGILGDLTRTAKQPIVPIYMPAGYDPADYTHEACVNMIRAASSSAGIELPVW